MAETPDASRPAWETVAISAAAVSTVIGVLTALAVSGILGQAQRNHGVLLLTGFAFVIGAATVWFIGTLLDPPKPPKDDGE